MDSPKAPVIGSPATFIKEVVAELKKVTWPTQAEIIKLTGVVIVLSVIVGAFIGILDTTFLRLTGALLGR